MPNSLLDDLPQVPGSESESSTETSVVATGTSVGSGTGVAVGKGTGVAVGKGVGVAVGTGVGVAVGCSSCNQGL